MELEYQRLEFLLCTNKKERIEGKRPSPKRIIHVRGFNQTLGSWVRHLGLWVCRLSSWVLLLGFAAGFIAGIHWFMGSPIRFTTGFVWFLLGFVFVWVRHCFYFVPCSWIFFRGEQRKKKRRDWLFGFLMWNSSVKTRVPSEFSLKLSL